MASSGSTTVIVVGTEAFPFVELIFAWSVKGTTFLNGKQATIIDWEMYQKTHLGGAIDSTASKSYIVTIDGQTFKGTNTVGIESSSTKQLASGTATIPHNADGTKTFSYSFSQLYMISWGTSQITEAEGSGSGVLPNLAQASTLSGSNGTLGTAQTLTITKASGVSSGYVHKISYKCGTASGYALGSNTTTGTGTSISWTPPLSLASQNTTGTSVSVDFVLGTYASTGDLVGYDYLTLTYSMPASVKPSVTFTLTDISGVGDIYGTPVRGLSRIKIVATATPSYGSPITSYKTTANGATYTTAEATTGTLKTAGDSAVTTTVTDKRGRTGSVSYTMKVKDYERPNVSKLAVHRSNASGAEDEQGEYIRVVFSAAVIDVGGLGKNTAAYKLRYKKSTATTYTEVAFSDLAGVYTVTDRAYIFAADSSSSYDVEIVAEDRHATTTRSTSASTAFTLMNWGANGTSLGIGKVAEKDHTLEVALDAEFTGSSIRLGNKYTLSTPGVANADGYILMARISITAANADTPITFVFSRRQEVSPMTVHVRLANSTATESSLASITYEGSNYGAFLIKAGELIWDLYVLKGSEWDTITLQDWWTSKTMESRVGITFPGTLVEALPGDYYRATPAKLDSLVDFIYPVGSVYISYSHVSPATLFGGTWVRIENAFLWGVDSSGTIGQTGGAKTHTLTENELPAHSHGSVYSQHAAGTKSQAWYTTAGTNLAYGAVSTGGGAAHNNMPPYVQVSIWRRTA